MRRQPHGAMHLVNPRAARLFAKGVTSVAVSDLLQHAYGAARNLSQGASRG